MRKFFTLLRISIKSNVYYRTSMILNMLTPLVVLLGQIFMWRGLYNLSSDNSFAGMTKSMMYSYILIAFVLNNLMNWSTESRLSKEIRNGDVVAKIIRPTSFLSQNIANMFGGVIVQGFFYVIFCIMIFSCFKDRLFIPTAANMLLFIVSAILGLIIRMAINDFFGLLCFYVTGYLGIVWMKNAIISFFSGAFIPITLFPEKMKIIGSFLPFEYMIHVPIAIFMGKYQLSEIAFGFCVQIGWIVFFFFLHSVIYRRIRVNMVIAGG